MDDRSTIASFINPSHSKLRSFVIVAVADTCLTSHHCINDHSSYSFEHLPLSPITAHKIYRSISVFS